MGDRIRSFRDLRVYQKVTKETKEKKVKAQGSKVKERS